MTPEQQAIIKALLAQQGQLTPMQQYQNAINNEQYGSGPGQTHPSVAMYQAGKPVAREPFDAREAMSAPQGRTEAAPGLDALFQSLSVQEKSAIMELVQQGAPIEQAFEAILGGALSAAAQGQ